MSVSMGRFQVSMFALVAFFLLTSTSVSHVIVTTNLVTYIFICSLSVSQGFSDLCDTRAKDNDGTVREFINIC